MGWLFLIVVLWLIGDEIVKVRKALEKIANRM